MTDFEYAEDYAAHLESLAQAGDLDQCNHLLDRWRHADNVEGPNDEWLQVSADFAAQSNHPEVLRLLLENGAKASTVMAAQAASTASPEVFEVMWEFGWRPDQVGKRDLPVIIRAVSNEPLLRWLLNRGADPFATHNNSTPLSHAANHGTISSIDLLLQHGARLKGSNALQAAVRREQAPDEERFPVLQHLLDLGIDINALEMLHGKPETDLRVRPTARGTALHAAVQADKPGRVKWLLEHGADVNATSPAGRTPLDWAVDGEKPKIVKILMNHGGVTGISEA